MSSTTTTTTTNNLLTASSPSEFFEILKKYEAALEKPKLIRQTNMPPDVSFPEEELLAELNLISPFDALMNYIQEEGMQKCRECNTMIWPEEDETCFSCFSKHMRECQEDPGDIPEKYRENSV
jgi:hypothetical protein